MTDYQHGYRDGEADAQRGVGYYYHEVPEYIEDADWYEDGYFAGYADEREAMERRRLERVRGRELFPDTSLFPRRV